MKKDLAERNTVSYEDEGVVAVKDFCFVFVSDSFINRALFHVMSVDK